MYMMNAAGEVYFGLICNHLQTLFSFLFSL